MEPERHPEAGVVAARRDAGLEPRHEVVERELIDPCERPRDDPDGDEDERAHEPGEELLLARRQRRRGEHSFPDRHRRTVPARPISSSPMTQEGRSAIETMLLEERSYPPPPEFAATANAQPGIYDRDPLEFWADEARKRVTWFEPFETVCEWELPVCEVVPRRQAEHHLQLRRPPRRGRERRPCRLLLGGRACRRPP